MGDWAIADSAIGDTALTNMFLKVVSFTNAIIIKSLLALNIVISNITSNTTILVTKLIVFLSVLVSKMGSVVSSASLAIGDVLEVVSLTINSSVSAITLILSIVANNIIVSSINKSVVSVMLVISNIINSFIVQTANIVFVFTVNIIELTHKLNNTVKLSVSLVLTSLSYTLLNVTSISKLLFVYAIIMKNNIQSIALFQLQFLKVLIKNMLHTNTSSLIQKFIIWTESYFNNIWQEQTIIDDNWEEK